MPKKKIKQVIKQTNDDWILPINTTVPENIVITFEQPIKLLGLNLDLGRQDLADNFRQIQDAVNKLIKKQ